MYITLKKTIEVFFSPLRNKGDRWMEIGVWRIRCGHAAKRRVRFLGGLVSKSKEGRRGSDADTQPSVEFDALLGIEEDGTGIVVIAVDEVAEADAEVDVFE